MLPIALAAALLAGTLSLHAPAGDRPPLPAMYGAVLDRARTDAAFRATVNAAVLRVLQAKQDHHLLGG